MATIKLWKRYADGDVRSIDVRDHEESILHLLADGYYLSEQEATDGKIAELPTPDDNNEAPEPTPEPAPKPPRKQTAKKKTGCASSDNETKSR